MLVGDHIVFVFGIDGLVLGRNKDVFWGNARPAEILEKVGDARLREMNVCAGGVAGLHDSLADTNYFYNNVEALPLLRN
jgi:hypothetical protein